MCGIARWIQENALQPKMILFFGGDYVRSNRVCYESGGGKDDTMAADLTAMLSGAIVCERVDTIASLVEEAGRFLPLSLPV